MLITNVVFLILSKLLVLSITQRWGNTAQMSYTAHTTKPILETTQEKKKESCTYLKVEVDNNCLCQQWGQCNLSQLNNTLIFISTVVVLIIWDDNEYIVVVYRAVSSMITSLAVAVTLIEMFWCTTTFQKECYTVFLTVSTTVRNQHALTLNQNCINV